MQLYKYAGLAGLKILEDLRLKVTPPNQFNDPFELTPRSRVTIKQGDMIEKVKNNPEYFRPVYNDMVEKEGYPYSFSKFLDDLPAQINKQYNKFLKLYGDALVEQDLASLNDASNYIGILCLTSTNNSIPMWSYYTDHHRGMVVGFDLNQTSFPHSVFSKIWYLKRRLSVDPQLRPPSRQWFIQVTKVIFSKSEEWKSENEYRFVFRLRDLVQPKAKGKKISFFVDISSSMVKEVILGCRVSKKREAQVRKILEAKRFSHVKLLRIKRDRKKFQFQIVSAAKSEN
jgi:hypothetical protein